MLQVYLLYALLATGLAFCLYLFYTVKVENRTAQKRVAARLDMLEAGLQSLCSRLDELRGDFESIGTEPVALTAPALRPGINLTKRTQVLRLHRRGESIPTIAGALAVPQKEVELLLKVQRLVAEQS